MRSTLTLTLTLTLTVSVSVSGCGTSRVGNNVDLSGGGGDGGGGGGDGFFFGDMSGSAGCDDQHPCAAGQRCLDMMCIPDNGTCTVDDDCENDTYCDCTGGGGDAGACMGGVCVPYGDGPRGLFDPDCMGMGFSASQFVAPKLKCSWTVGGASAGTLVAPIVADLDGDKKPEIVFDSYPSRFAAIHGADCTTYFDKQFAFAESNQSQLAVADLDADGVPEIVGLTAAHQVVVFDNKGNVLATAPTAYMQQGANGGDWSGPAIADVDGVAPPEIIVAGQVSRYVKGQGIKVLWTQNPVVPEFGSMSIANDLDGDGKMEVIAGKTVYDGLTGADKTPANLKALQGVGAFPALGDFNGDKKPDIVLVQAAQGQEQVSIFDYNNNKFIFGPFAVPNGWGGPPTVADVDGDGIPEFASAGPDNYYVFSMKCQPGNKGPKCDQATNFGVLWKKNTQDHSSGGTGSTMFDFNGDGAAEVVYRDECWLRVYNGPDGKTVFAANVTSATALELPVVADVDNDGHADIVVTSDEYGGQLCPQQAEAETGTKWTGNTAGIFVYQDPMNRWMPSRSLWNEHSYHITNINDNLTVPTAEKPNWTSFNNYRQNVQGLAGGGKPSPDFTGGVATGVDAQQADCTNSWILHANVCNRGAAPVAAGVPGSFYTSDPRMGMPKPVCTAKTTMTLMPGDCEVVQCTWMNPPQAPTDLWFRADDDGNGMPLPECHPKNDVLYLPQQVCMKIG